MTIQDSIELLLTLLLSSLELSPPVLLASSIILVVINHLINHKNDKK